MEIIDVPIEQLKFADYNPRKMSKAEKRKLKESIKNFGFVEPVVVNKHQGRENTIVGGHQRVDAGIEMGIKTVPVVYVDLDIEKEKILNLALNKISGEWHFSKLQDVLQNLVDTNAPMYLTGFDDHEIAAILQEEKEKDEDFAPDWPESTTIKSGQLWKLGNHLLLCGDSTKNETWTRLMNLDKLAIVFTDPPYGIFYSDKGGIAESRSGKKWAPISNDDLQGQKLTDFLVTVFNNMKAFSEENSSYYICMADVSTYEIYSALREAKIYYTMPIVWVKPRPTISWNRYHPQHEPLLYSEAHERIAYTGEGAKPTGPASRWFGPKNESTVWRIETDPNKEYKHPTQKPVKLAYRAILNSTEEGEIVVDPFGGSGSTMIACEILKRKCRMIELDPGYCEVIIRRWELFTGKEAELL